jgi:hypothetical protein
MIDDTGISSNLGVRLLAGVQAQVQQPHYPDPGRAYPSPTPAYPNPIPSLPNSAYPNPAYPTASCPTGTQAAGIYPGTAQSYPSQAPVYSPKPNERLRCIESMSS